MEIIENRALLVKTRNPYKITETIPGASILNTNEKGIAEVLVDWDLGNAMVLQNLGFKKVPSPILSPEQYKWPGVYTPFEHQKDTAAFITLNRRAFCLSEMGCVDAETEYLSPTGWVKISEYIDGEVAQYHPETKEISFVTPNEYVKLPCAEMIHFKTQKGIDQMLSPEHRMLIHSRTYPEKWVVMQAADMLNRHDIAREGGTVATVGSRKYGTNTVSFRHACAPTTFNYVWGAGIPITENDLRLQIAVIADGYFGNNTTRCVIRVKKQRKIKRLKQLLADTGRPYKLHVIEEGSAIGFNVFSFEAPLRCKEFDARFMQCSTAQIDIVYDEVLHWDGSFDKGKRFARFTSVSKQSADFIQLVFASKGHTTRKSAVIQEDKYRSGVCYNLNIRPKSNGLVGYYAANTENTTAQIVPSTDGFKYCFMVPSTFLLFRRKGCIFASGNTGKTVSVAWAADYLMRLGAIKRVLIIAPLSILDCAWRGDLFKTVMHRRVAIAHGTRSARVKAINSGAEFVIINYDGVPSVYEELFCANFDMIVCDESTNLKNANIRRWKKINALIRPNTWVLLMTGSPISQSPLDAYGQARLVNPSSVPSYYESFKSDLMLRVGPYKWVPKPDATERVYALLQPAIRYTKEECFDLPEQLYTTQELSMTPQQEKYYEALRKELLFETSGVEVSAVNAAVLMNKLLQVAAGSVYADYDVDQTHRAVLDFDCSEKFNAMLEIIEQATHKTLIFATYQHTIERIQEFLNTKGVTNDVIYGKVAPRKRQAIIQDFQTTDKVKVLILHPRTASHGITLTAANTVIWFSPTTSAEAYIQANARVHRAGQRNPSLVVHLCNSPVEKQLYRALSERTTTQAELLEMYKNVLKISA